MGFVVKTHGYKGQLKIEVDEEYEFQDFLLLSINQKFVPFEIENVNEQGFLIKLKNIDSEDKASELVGLDILELLELEKENSTYNNYSLVNLIDGVKYSITNTIELPSQILLEIRVNYKDILIPFHEDLGAKIDETNKTIYMNFPDGILDL